MITLIKGDYLGIELRMIWIKLVSKCCPFAVENLNSELLPNTQLP